MSSPRLSIRAATPADAVVCGGIAFEAFAAINRDHGFPPELPAPEAGIGGMSMLFLPPRFYCVGAELDWGLVGSYRLGERSGRAGVGAPPVRPRGQAHRVGR